MSGGRRHTIVVQPCGAVEFVHSDAIRLGDLGEPSVVRLSNVEYEGGTWVARDAQTGKVIASSDVRGECIAKEVEHFTELLKRGGSLFAPEQERRV